MTLSGEELLWRFLLHVLPKGCMRIKHFGFLTNPCRAQRLGQIRMALEARTRCLPSHRRMPAPSTVTPAPSADKDGYR